MIYCECNIPININHGVCGVCLRVVCDPFRTITLSSTQGDPVQPVFKPHSSVGSKPRVLANFRVSEETHQAVIKAANDAGITIGDLLRQMVDFALKHYKPEGTPK